MKIKMVSFYVNKSSQAFATFEYQKVKFDMFKNLNDFNWKFLEDERFLYVNKIYNLEKVKANCDIHLSYLNSILH